MTIVEFEKRASNQGGDDRVIDAWKVIDIHIIPNVLKTGSEFDFYCSDDKFVSLLRIRICNKDKGEKLHTIDDKYNDITYFVAEIHMEDINDQLIRELLDKFSKKRIMIDIRERLRGCLMAGAVGDAIGFRYESAQVVDFINFDFDWQISDDTQLTLATCEAIYKDLEICPEKVAARMLYWFNKRRLRGVGASTLKALQELDFGGHWALVGRSGEYAAGNGAAMRIAPLAFKKYATRLQIKDICYITHRNDEAYAGALAIYYSVKAAINGDWTGGIGLIDYVVDHIPDMRIRDRFIEIASHEYMSIAEFGKKYKSTGYVVDSVPLAIFAAQKLDQLNYKTIITELIKLGGDTDTVCSMFGQIAGTLYGTGILPDDWLLKTKELKIGDYVSEITNNWKE